MKLRNWRDPVTGDLHCEFTISETDQVKAASLDGFDFLLLRECESSDAISDKLLALELMARKIEQGSSST